MQRFKIGYRIYLKRFLIVAQSVVAAGPQFITLRGGMEARRKGGRLM